MTIAGKILIASIPMLISIYSKNYKFQDELVSFPDPPKNFNLPIKETFDFILLNRPVDKNVGALLRSHKVRCAVELLHFYPPEGSFVLLVGGGAAGCIVATRLSKHFSVLVLEAGSKPPPFVDVPGLRKEMKLLPEINFLYRSTPQKNSGLETQGVISFTSGKMLGGSGSHNDAAWERGHPMDYDHWADLTNDVSWKYENVEKYFSKIEKNKHTNTGQLDLVHSSLSKGVNVWLEAGKELGYKIRDPSLPQSIGFNRVIHAAVNGSGENTYKSYLQPVLKKRRTRLVVRTYSVVSRIIFNDKINKTAIGVQYERHGVASAAFARKEIILSAGAIMSPIILFKSGIGPKDQVKAAKAETHIADLPVGKNFHDHPQLTFHPIYVEDASLTWSLERNLTFKDIQDYKKDRQGPLTTAFHGGDAFKLSEARRQLKWPSNGVTKGQEYDANWPDIQVVFHVSAQEAGAVEANLFVGRPLSRGVLRINSTATGMDDNYLPLPDYNFYSNQLDLDIMVEALKFFLKIMEDTVAFQSVGAKLSGTPYEPCKKYKFRSDDYWKCFVRYKTVSGKHATGSCTMGRDMGDQEGAVVDSKLRVIGVKGVRVVDASIFPFVPNANIYAPVMVVAEKEAAEILKYHRRHIRRRNRF